MIRRLLLLFAVIAPLGAVLLWHLSPPAAILTIFVSHMLLLYPTLRPNVQWLGPVVTGFDTPEREVWLTIDDGPDAADCAEILTILRDSGARATFFVVGEKVRANPEVARTVLKEGHSLGNHSNSHPSASFWCLGPAAIAAEIDRCNTALFDITGTAPSLFRAPVGMKNPFVHPILSRRSMTLVGWTARGFDTVSSDVESIVARLLQRVRPGAILLLHQGHRDGQGRHFNPQVLGSLLARLNAGGYRCVIPPPESFRAR